MLLNSKILRWFLLVLYLIFIILAFSGYLTEWLSGTTQRTGDRIEGYLYLVFMLISQALFIFSISANNLSQPIELGRLFFPVIVTSLIMMFFTFGIVFVLMEFLSFDYDWRVNIVWIIAILGGVFWGIMSLVRYRGYEKYRIFKILVTTIILISLLGLLIMIPAYYSISKRSSSSFTSVVLIAYIGWGVIILLWSFGLVIILPFLRKRYQEEKKQD